MKIKVLHVLGSLNRGGAETWFVNLLRAMDREQFRIDVMVHTSNIGVYKDDVRMLGSKIFVCPRPRNPLVYSKSFHSIVRNNGPYRVLHAHLQLFNGFLMKLGHDAGIPVRVAHSRNSSDGSKLTLPRQIYKTLMRRWIAKYSTKRLAVSRKAADGAFGPRYGSEKYCEMMSSGIDFRSFQEQVDPAEIRSQIGIKPESRVIGHVGSFTDKKNHKFLIEIAAKMLEKDPALIFLLIGDGILREKIVQQVDARKMQQSFLFLGDRPDVSRLMLGAMDLLIFPSLFEGLPRVLLEAQAAALPCLASSTITREVQALPRSVEFLPLEADAHAWADRAFQILDAGRDWLNRPIVFKMLDQKGFSIAANATRLEEIYWRQLG